MSKNFQGVNLIPQWFNFLEWIIVSSVIFFAYFKTENKILLIVLFINFLFFTMYFASLIFSSLESIGIKLSVWFSYVVSFIVSLILANFAYYIVIQVTFGSV